MTTTTTIIRIQPGQVADTLALWGNSALRDCTDAHDDASGAFMAQRWPSLSSGEALLWAVMAWLNGAPDCPSVADLLAGLDTANAEAALEAIRAGGGL